MFYLNVNNMSEEDIEIYVNSRNIGFSIDATINFVGLGRKGRGEEMYPTLHIKEEKDNGYTNS